MYAMLVVQEEDELAILKLVLQRAGLAVTTARSIDSALASWAERPADIIVVVVDKSLPDMVHAMRRETIVPLLIITNVIGEEVHTELLRAGADQIIQRPYSARLLIAQVQAFMRRAGNAPLVSLPTMNVPGMQLDPASRLVEVEGKEPRRLTHLEFRLLYTLMINRGQIMPIDMIVEKVWGYSGEGDRDLVRGLVNRLRNKVEPDPRHPRYIQTEPGIGYILRVGDL